MSAIGKSRKESMNTPLVLVDMMNLVFRSHYAHRHLSFDGQPTGVIYGVLKSLQSLRKQFGDRIIFCCDYGVPGDKRLPPWRLNHYEDYKKNRDNDPEKVKQRELATSQIPALYDMISALGYGFAGLPDCEADDVIGMLASCEGEVVIYSGDKDLYQLLEGRRVRIARPKKTSTGYELVNQALVEAEFGIDIKDWPLYLALGGDNSDNIHVVHGLGPKKAIAIIQAGVDLRSPFELNSEKVKRLAAICESHWFTLRDVLEVTRIPRKLDDERVWPYNRGHIKRIESRADSYTRVVVGDEEELMSKFQTFCADYGMNEFLADREKFIF